MIENFKKYVKNIDNIESSFIFIPDKKLPDSIKISTPMNFVHIGSELLLSLDKDNSWNVVCGKVEEGENWQEALRRETVEEVGVKVGELHLVGYVLCTNAIGSKFEPTTIFPVCYSFVTSILNDWKPRETKDRELFSHSNVLKEFKKREDEDHLLEIYKYVHSIFNKDITYLFEYIPDIILSNIPVTSAMTFCFNNQMQFCVVRDVGENFLSLPGGGCGICEDPEKCSLRELFEEAQIIPKDNTLLGSILVSFFKDGKEVSKMQQVRYFCQVDSMEEFIPEKGGFETDIRDFVSFDKLSSSVKQLMNDTGKQILSHLKNKLNL